MDLRTKTNATLATLGLMPKIFAPFLVMIILSLLTKRNSKEALDRFYVKMKTPVNPNRAIDGDEIQKSYEKPGRFDHLKLFPKSDIEIVRPKLMDVAGFSLAVLGCFVVRQAFHRN